MLSANNYQDEESEQWIGEWMKERGNRDEIVIATKFTTYYPAKRNDSIRVRANYQGQHAKGLHMSLEASLKKLQTDYIDLVYTYHPVLQSVQLGLKLIFIQDLRPLVGLYHFDPGGDAKPQSHGCLGQGPLSGHQRYSCLDSQQS
jgi:aryl-alcohol dehydrogenase-like predicted oxidoreductase